MMRFMQTSQGGSLRVSFCFAVLILGALVSSGRCYAQANEVYTIADVLDESDFKEPLVAPLVDLVDVAQARGLSANSSLKEVARVCGLELMSVGNIKVLAPPARADFRELATGRAKPAKTVSNLCNLIICSLSEKQLRKAGSTEGLSFAEMSPAQKELLSEVFSHDVAAVVVKPGGELDPAGIVPGSSLDYRSCRLLARLEGGLTVGAAGQSGMPGGGFGGLGRMGFGTRAQRTAPGYVLADMTRRDEYGSLTSYGAAPDLWKPRLVKNTLKPSDLDYDSEALRATVGIQGKVSLATLISKVADATGMKLHATSGSDQVALFLKNTSQVEAGALLKATSLATTGTWRRLGDMFIFTIDKAGMGQLAARYRELQGQFDRESQRISSLAFGLLKRGNVLTVLPFDTESPIRFTMSQLETLKKTADTDGSSLRMAWRDLTTAQKRIVEGYFQQWSERGFSIPEDRSSLWFVPSVAIKATLVFPKLGPVLLSPEVPGGVQNVRLLPLSDGRAPTARITEDAPAGTSFRLSGQMRGYLSKPSAKETPESLVKLLGEHGFDTLFLRVFTDGRTAFPSSFFPQIDGLSKDYLAQVIALAHNNGIRVFAVLDVLRWTAPAYLDRDVLGRSKSEWARARTISKAQAAEEQLLYGEGLTGDAVNPFHPAVGRRLRGLVSELAPYKVDGIAFDYTSMMLPSGYSSRSYYGWCPGYTEEARMEFLMETGVDGLDVPPLGTRLQLDMLPLQPIAGTCIGVSDKFEGLYRMACDNLLDSLLRSWSKAGRKSDVWIIDTFGIDRPSNDLEDFASRTTGIIRPLSFVSRQSELYAPRGMAVVPLVRTSEYAGTLGFADALAKIGDTGVVIDFTCAGAKKADYLKMIVQ